MTPWKWTDDSRSVAATTYPILDRQGNQIGEAMRSVAAGAPELAGVTPAEPDPRPDEPPDRIEQLAAVLVSKGVLQKGDVPIAVAEATELPLASR